MVGPWMLTVDPQMLWGTDEVCVDVIMVLDWGRVRSGWTWTLSWFGPWTLWRTDEACGFGPWMLWGTDDVWVDVIMVLTHGCTGQRMRSGCAKSWFWPTDALRNG